MKRMKLALAATAAATAMLLSACGGAGASAQAGPASPAPSDLKADVSYAYWDVNQKPAMEKIIAQFNQKYPNIKVTSEITPWAQYWTKLQTEGSSNTLPDVFWMNGPNFQLYASNGQLAPLTPLTDSKQVDPGNYPDALNKLYSLDGKPYGVPKDFDTIGLWYNKAIFAEAGVATPTADWKWEDFHKAAKTISDKLKSKGIYGVAASLTGGQEAYYDTILQAGGNVISADGKKSGYDDPQSIKGLQLWTDLIADGSSPTLQQMSDTPANKWFDNGKAAMEWTGTWQVSEIKASPVSADASVAPLPSVTQGNRHPRPGECGQREVQEPAGRPGLPGLPGHQGSCPDASPDGCRQPGLHRHAAGLRGFRSRLQHPGIRGRRNPVRLPVPRIEKHRRLEPAGNRPPAGRVLRQEAGS